MPKREYIEYIDPATGLAFLFAQDGPNLLHIEARHGVTAEEAIRTFRDGAEPIWNANFMRYQTESETHVLYWAKHASGAILVITCFRKGE